MPQSELARLRQRRRYTHRQLDRYEPWVARLRDRLAETEAAIQVIAPELNLPPRRYAPSPYFARGELPRIVMDILRTADSPLATREIAVKALARKGVPLPDRRAMKLTRLRVAQLFVEWQRRGVVQSVGEGRETRRELIR